MNTSMAFSFVCCACLPYQIPNIANQHGWYHTNPPDIILPLLGCPW